MPAPERLLDRALAGPDPWRLDLPPAGHTAEVAGLPSVLLQQLEERPGIVTVSGVVSGPLLELALFGDRIVAHRNARLRAGKAPPQLARTPWRLARRLGAGQALGFWLDRRGWSAARAATRGLVDALSDDPRAAADRVAERWRAAGTALPALRRLTRSAGFLGERAALALERAEFALLFAQERPRAAARAFLRRP